MNFLGILLRGGGSLKTLLGLTGLIGWMTSLPPLDSLPDDPNALKTIILQQARRIEQLEHYLSRLQRWHFDSKTERVPEEQLLFGFAGTMESAPPEEEEPPPPRNRRRPHGRRVIPPGVPKRVTVHDLAEQDRHCRGCGRDRTFVGYDETKRLEFTPAQFYQDVHLRKKYICKPCDEKPVTAKGPALLGPTERGLPGPGLLAHVLVSKFGDHLPLYRQSRIFERHGVPIPRSTLCDWVRQAVGLLQPIVSEMARDVLRSRILQTDDTVVRLIEPGLGKCRQARLWGYMGNGQVVYQFTATREQKWPLAFLNEYRGYVQCDAYKGYDRLFYEGSGRFELACWAHARRYFFEAKDTDPDRALRAMSYIRALYKVEAEGREFTPESRTALRNERSRPILRELRKWLEQESLRVLPKSPMGEAVRYAILQWEALIRYVEVGDAEIDNNRIERALRGVALGRKNYLHYASENGGEWGAVAYSIIESCRMNKVEPWAYLKDVLMRVWTHPSGRIAELMPRSWRPPPTNTS